MRNIMTIFALLAVAAAADANGRAQVQVRAQVRVQPIRVRQVVQPIRVRQVVQPIYAAPIQQVVQPIYSAPIVQQVQQESYCQPQAIVQQQYAAPLQIQQYAMPIQVQQQYAQPILQQSYGAQLNIGGGFAVTRRQGLFERLGERQGDRRDNAALRRAPGASAIIVR